MSDSYIILGAILLVVIGSLLIFGATFLIKNKTKKNISKEIEDLEVEKNLIISSSLINELNKVEGLINNKKLEEQLKKWKDEFSNLQDKELPKLSDEIIEAESLAGAKDFKEAEVRLSQAELDVYYVKTKADALLESIKEVTQSEERNRETVTKLKSLYREIVFKYNKSKNEFSDITESIDLQLERIDKLFGAFEVTIKNNDFDETNKIVRALNDLIHNISVVIEETPTVILLGKMILPKKMNDVRNIHKKMIKDGFNLEYINLEYNLEESEKKLEVIFDKLKVLNLEDSIFELKTMADYFDSLYSDFDKEKRSKRDYERGLIAISDKLASLFKIIKNVYNELGDLKDTYDLTTEEISAIDEINKEIVTIRDDFKLINDRTLSKVTPFSKLCNDCELIAVKLSKTEDKLEDTLKNLGSLREDEARARDQLSDIRLILRDAKAKIKEYKLPVIPKKFLVELKEAHDAIKEIIKELEKKPISIKTLNTRVDTARDLALKLNNTSHEISKSAAMAEIAIVYGNRYRSSFKEVAAGLNNAEKDFFKGEYKSSLEIVLNALNIVEPGIHKKLLNRYQD